MQKKTQQQERLERQQRGGPGNQNHLISVNIHTILNQDAIKMMFISLFTMLSYLCEAIFRQRSGSTGGLCRETDLLALCKWQSGYPVQVAVADPTSQTEETDTEIL